MQTIGQPASKYRERIYRVRLAATTFFETELFACSPREAMIKAPCERKHRIDFQTTKTVTRVEVFDDRQKKWVLMRAEDLQ